MKDYRYDHFHNNDFGPDATAQEIRRALRIRDNLNDRPAKEALQKYIDELEALLSRGRPRVDWQP